MLGEVARRYGNEGLPDGTVRVDFHGVAGQSFGAWLACGLTFTLEGTTNDYVGKGLSGGRLAVTPFQSQPTSRPGASSLATWRSWGDGRRGALRGFAGERFAVRNSAPTRWSRA